MSSTLCYLLGVSDDPATGLRAARSAVTRAAILGAARTLFAEAGYTGTSIRRLAEVAGVATRTVYLTFGSKEGVLQALTDDLGPTAGEPALRAIGETLDDPATLLALVAQLYRNLYEHGHDVIVLLHESAATAPAARSQYEAGLARSRASVAQLCERLDELGALRPGLSVDAATGHALVLLSHGAYDELVVRRGWDHDTYQTWLRDGLGDALLGPPAERRSR